LNLIRGRALHGLRRVTTHSKKLKNQRP